MLTFDAEVLVDTQVGQNLEVLGHSSFERVCRLRLEGTGSIALDYEERR